MLVSSKRVVEPYYPHVALLLLLLKCATQFGLYLEPGRVCMNFVVSAYCVHVPKTNNSWDKKPKIVHDGNTIVSHVISKLQL